MFFPHVEVLLNKVICLIIEQLKAATLENTVNEHTLYTAG